MSFEQESDATQYAGGDFLWKEPVASVLPNQPQPAAASEPPKPLPAGWIAPVAGPSSLSRAYSRANRWIGSLVHGVTLPEDGAPADPFGKLVASTPPWFISLIVHFSVMIVLGLVALEAHNVITKKEDSVEVDLAQPKDNEIYAEKIGEQLKDPSIPFSTPGPDVPKAVAALSSKDLPQVNDPLVSPPILEPSPNGTMKSGTVNTPAIGLEFSGREEGVRQAMLLAFGGTKSTEDAVKEALAWLVRQQKPRGTWSMVGPYKGGARAENEEAATAMALLAFQGAGYTPSGTQGEAFTRAVIRGWKALLRSEQSDGRFFNNKTAEQHELYTQAMCTIALCELYGMTREEEFHEPAQRAVDYCVKIQAPEGGWRYQPGVDADLSVTGWFAMALQSARMAGLEVPSPTYAAISKFLDSVQFEEGRLYAYHVGDGATQSVTAEGLLCRQYLGWKHEDRRLRGGVDFILQNLPQWDKRNVYYWYYATQVCHHMEGSDWVKWNNVMRQLLPENQEKRGAERGSWEPNGDRWGDAGGRLYVTCLSTYTLEVYYRHLPIYHRGIMNQ